MTTITLPDDLARRLADVAKLRGTTTEQVVLEGLRQAFPEAPAVSTGQGTLYDALKPFIGKFSSGGGATLSENCSERFTDHLVEKHQRGRL